jgi:hypothetical protein
MSTVGRILGPVCPRRESGRELSIRLSHGKQQDDGSKEWEGARKHVDAPQ